jgi:hypothetical protein
MTSSAKRSRAWRILAIAAMLMSLGVSAVAADPGISPASVTQLIFPGESYSLGKTVGTPSIPPKIDLCVLEDETASFSDDIANFKAAAPGLFASIVAAAPDSQFGVHGFRDYPISPFGAGGDWVHRKLSALSPSGPAFVAGVNALTAGGGADIPEALLDAVVATVQGPDACEWRADPEVTRVLVAITDAPAHLPGGGKPHVNTVASTVAALTANDVRVIGLVAPGADGTLAALAAATGGSTQALSSSGNNIAAGILAGLENLPLDVAMQSDCVAPIGTAFEPASLAVTSGSDAAFIETISVAAGAAGGTYSCKDTATIDGAPLKGADDQVLFEQKTIHVPGITLAPLTDTNELGVDLDHTVTATIAAGDFGPVAGVRVEFAVTGTNAAAGFAFTDAAGEAGFTYAPPVAPASLGPDTIAACFTNLDDTVEYGCAQVEKIWRDTTPPVALCYPSVNPDGVIPAAPGNGGKGQNQDGFYGISADDIVSPDESLQLFVTDSGTGTVFGPFPVGTDIKYVQAPGGKPDQKPGSGAVEFFLKGQGDALVTAVDGSGNTSEAVSCLVPPKPQ